MATSKAKEVVFLAPMKTKEVTVRIESMDDSSLVVHQFGDKERRKMAEKQAKTANKGRGREARDPEAEYEAAFHRLSDGSYGFPAHGIKASIANAAHRDLGFPRTAVYKAVFVHPDDPVTNCVRIEHSAAPKMRTDVVRLESGVADLRYRPEFQDWAMNLRITIDEDWINVDTLVALIQRAGFGVGIGEWRPQKGVGNFGRYKVAVVEEDDGSQV